MEADDVDAGFNGKVQFSLDNESKHKFSIDSYSGVLTVSSNLDREQVNESFYLSNYLVVLN